MSTAVTPEFQRKTILKVSWRLLPLIVLAYLVAYIDRTNVSFAALTMNKDVGLSAYLYGWGAGIFFFGYALFEVPSNIVLQRTSARLWIARIMITWGIISGLMATVTGPVSFLVLRFLLGVAEARFFPGIIFYLTYWFPSVYRARAISILYVAIPVSNAVASVISGAILEMDGVLGLAGWQWIFIIEAIPAVLLAFVVLRLMTERPAVAEWLTAEERDWLEAELQAERTKVESAGHISLLQSFTDLRVVALAMIYFTGVTASYGIVFFLPQIIKGLGLSNMATGLVTAIPYTIGTIGLLVWGYSSDRLNERRWHLIISTTVAAVGIVCRRLVEPLLLGGRRHLDRHGRHLWFATLVLADALAVPHRGGGRVRHGVHQFDRQPRRLCRTLHRGLDQGQHEELRDGSVFPGGVRAVVRRDLFFCHARDRHPESARAARGEATRRKVKQALIWTVAMIASSTAIGEEASPLLFGTATPGGGFAVYGQAVVETLAETDPELSIELRATKGSAENIPLLEAGKLDLAVVEGTIAHEALAGSDARLRISPSLRRCTRALECSWSVRIRPTGSIHDLRGQRVVFGAEGSGLVVLARYVLDGLGLSLQKDFDAVLLKSAKDGPPMVLSGDAAALWGGGIGWPGFEAVARGPRGRAFHRAGARRHRARPGEASVSESHDRRRRLLSRARPRYRHRRLMEPDSRAAWASR